MKYGVPAFHLLASGFMHNTCQPMKSNVIYNVKFLTIYPRMTQIHDVIQSDIMLVTFIRT